MTTCVMVATISNGDEDGAGITKLNDCFVMQSMMYNFNNFFVKSFFDNVKSEIRVVFLFETDLLLCNFAYQLYDSLKNESGVEFLCEYHLYKESFGEMSNSLQNIDKFNDVTFLETTF